MHVLSAECLSVMRRGACLAFIPVLSVRFEAPHFMHVVCTDNIPHSNFLPLQDGESKIVTVKSAQLLGSFFQHKLNEQAD